MLDMRILTVGVKLLDAGDKIFIMRYTSSRSWTIPNIIINCEKDEENDTICLNGAFQLIPAGINVMSLNKIIDCEDEESIKSDSKDDDNSISVVHRSVIFEAHVETTENHALLDISLKFDHTRLKFDYMQWIPQDSLINVPFTNRITKKLAGHNIQLLPMVLSGII